MFLEILEYRVENNKKKCLGETVLEMWSQILLKKKPNFKYFKTFFQIKVLILIVGFQKTYSFNPSLKKTLGLHLFNSLRQEEEKVNLKTLNSTLKISLGPYLAVLP